MNRFYGYVFDINFKLSMFMHHQWIDSNGASCKWWPFVLASLAFMKFQIRLEVAMSKQREVETEVAMKFRCTQISEQVKFIDTDLIPFLSRSWPGAFVLNLLFYVRAERVRRTLWMHGVFAYIQNALVWHFWEMKISMDNFE